MTEEQKIIARLNNIQAEIAEITAWVKGAEATTTKTKVDTRPKEEQEFDAYLMEASKSILNQSENTQKTSVTAIKARIGKLTNSISFQGLRKVNFIDLMLSYKVNEQLLTRVIYDALNDYNVSFEGNSVLNIQFADTELEQYKNLCVPTLEKLLEGNYNDFNEFYLLFTTVRQKIQQLLSSAKRTQIRQFFVPSAVSNTKEVTKSHIKVTV